MIQNALKIHGRTTITIMLFLLVMKISYKKAINHQYYNISNQENIVYKTFLSNVNDHGLLDFRFKRNFLNVKDLNYLKLLRCNIVAITNNTLQFPFKLKYVSNNNFKYNYILPNLVRKSSSSNQQLPKHNNNHARSISFNLFMVVLFISILSFLYLRISLLYITKRKNPLNLSQQQISLFWDKVKRLILVPKCKQKEHNHLIRQQKYQQIFQQLKETIESKQLFLDPGLSQQDVIKYLGTNRNYLYQAIKLCSTTNFSGFINFYRVQHAQEFIREKIIANERFVLSDIYSSCGFSTNESFYRIFKATTGITPGDYMKGIENVNISFSNNTNSINDQREKDKNVLEYNLP